MTDLNVKCKSIKDTFSYHPDLTFTITPNKNAFKSLNVVRKSYKRTSKRKDLFNV